MAHQHRTHIQPRNTPCTIYPCYRHTQSRQQHHEITTHDSPYMHGPVILHHIVVLVGSSPCSITRESNDRGRFRMGTRGDDLRIGLQDHGRIQYRAAVDACRARKYCTQRALRNEQRRKSLLTYVIYSVHTLTAVESRNKQLTAC